MNENTYIGTYITVVPVVVNIVNGYIYAVCAKCAVTKPAAIPNPANIDINLASEYDILPSAAWVST